MKIIKAQSPAGFAEEYIVDSIWNNRFPPGSILPAERELSELIGVTRTTLREVLQRLARDGWLTIQHGKPTKVNNYWDTCGLNILPTLAKLDAEGVGELIDQLLSARTNFSAIYVRAAIKNSPEQVIALTQEALAVSNDPQEFADFDYHLNHELAHAAGNIVFVLVLNGFKGLWSKIAKYYFSHEEARALSRKYYEELEVFTKAGKHDESIALIRKFGLESAKIWQKVKEDLPLDLVE
ncbi:fatty acid metabolism transcriptional regulator FadR [Psychrosphaera sp. F3M07]|jgi:GntR family negative regulator for fad regulon and positive regulator of fabA|uniref:Fatty acid metabolism regulator protein n=1 Tax=Psychrosphaera aquimarina TaxID=2044854 RepID=A0ABU3QX21_9GAMM|nr:MULTISPECIES: fatty acid metabolism transcriptional regulator FadR [Psychrosphaera]MBU2916417.1 fatty acid metabolism transcriptional regulator FadR [Psychrosphaera sp. F3M07]MDU0111991.1 fatty acid metabolism transcriptional regulator FadR [Psychrosphaera aquimarina]MDU0114604.1 fatty acid metabolism transcriptional regulator FadR [Psychrosphaera aquimarina]